jgi:hypothetical protein
LTCWWRVGCVHDFQNNIEYHDYEPHCVWITCNYCDCYANDVLILNHYYIAGINAAPNAGDHCVYNVATVPHIVDYKLAVHDAPNAL